MSMKKNLNIRPEPLTVVMVPIEELEPYAFNARTHSDDQVRVLAESIKTFGFTNPVLIHSSRRIIAGHGRVLAAKFVGFTEVPCIVLANLSDARIRAYTIADNQIASMAAWDYDLLAAEIEALKDLDFDVSNLGFSQSQLDELLGTPVPPEAPEEKEKPEKDTAICPKCHHEFVL